MANNISKRKQKMKKQNNWPYDLFGALMPCFIGVFAGVSLIIYAVLHLSSNLKYYFLISLVMCFICSIAWWLDMKKVEV